MKNNIYVIEHNEIWDAGFGNEEETTQLVAFEDVNDAIDYCNKYEFDTKKSDGAYASLVDETINLLSISPDELNSNVELIKHEDARDYIEKHLNINLDSTDLSGKDKLIELRDKFDFDKVTVIKNIAVFEVDNGSSKGTIGFDLVNEKAVSGLINSSGEELQDILDKISKLSDDMDNIYDKLKNIEDFSDIATKDDIEKIDLIDISDQYCID